MLNKALLMMGAIEFELEDELNFSCNFFFFLHAQVDGVAGLN